MIRNHSIQKKDKEDKHNGNSTEKTVTFLCPNGQTAVHSVGLGALNCCNVKINNKKKGKINPVDANVCRIE